MKNIYIIIALFFLSSGNGFAQTSIMRFYEDKDSDNLGVGDGILVNVATTTPPPLYSAIRNGDCDDNNRAIGMATIWFLDNDGDGYGSTTSFPATCERPLKGVKNSTDCNDSDPLVNAAKTWYGDSDGDGFGFIGNPIVFCGTPPANAVENNEDTDIFNKGSFMGSPSLQLNAIAGGLSDKNYILSITPKQPVTQLTSITSANDVIMNITYFDGLGRPVQKIANAQSASGKDIITHIPYNNVGKMAIEYLPYASTDATMLYNKNASNNIYNYYSAIYGQTHVYSETIFEKSPLYRVLNQGAPGVWQAGNGNDVKFDYITNATQEVKFFKTTANWNSSSGIYDISISSPQLYYNQNELYKTVVKDENWKPNQANLKNNTIEEFKNKKGQLVLKRGYSDGLAHDTYYVYDQYGNLTYVLPPKATDLINVTNLPSNLTSVAVVPSAGSLSLVATNSIILSNGFHAKAGSAFTASIDNSTQNILDNLCYQYKYDNRNRLVEKKIPGKQWEFIIYDKLDRPVATGPAYSPFDDLTTVGWLITKYDAFSRPVITGWFPTAVTSTTRVTLQNTQNGYTTNFNETKIATATNSTVNGVAFRYSNVAWPTSGYHVLTVNYFDDYNYPDAPTIPTKVLEEPVFYNTAVKPKGLPTGLWIRTLQSSTAYANEFSYSLYDKKARPIRTYTQNHLKGYTYTDSKLDFTGKIDSTITYHRRIMGSSELRTKEVFTYSPQGRLLTQTHQIGTGIVELIASNTYDELGQLISKKVGNTIAVPTQKIDYTYNIRGWLKSINNVAALQQTGAPKDLFAFAINYDTTSSGISGVNALYNGNIAETQWVTNSDGGILRTYGYRYDELNRLKEGLYKKGAVLDMYNESLTYDKNGNIMSLKRNGNSEVTATQIDNLTYSYGPTNSINQLTKAVDNAPAGSKTNGFVDSAANSEDDYSYDANGNMIKDNNKNITAISYNHLNLPTKIRFGTAGNIVYIYNATGQKLQKLFTQGSTTIITDYLGAYQYEKNGTGTVDLKFFPTAEGYVEPSGSSYKYVYQYKDHLGNVRLSYKNTGTATSLVLQVQEESNYYPFGMKHLGYGNNVIVNSGYKYKYNGKELQDELGLNMYDYGWRNYDPALGRWMNIDNMAEKYVSTSPYHYAGNNPVLNLDVDGNEFTTSAWKWVNKVIAEINSRQEKNNKSIADYQSKIANGGSDRDIAKWNRRINSLSTNNEELETVRGETATLAASNQKYDVEEDGNGTQSDALGNSSTVNQTYYKTSNDNVTITVSSGTSISLFAHELKHAYQFETGQTSLAFDKQPVVNFLHDGWDEVSGYSRGRLFGQNENIYNPEDLTKLGLYSGLQSGPTSVHNHRYNLLEGKKIELNALAKRMQQAFRINNTTYNGKK